MAWRIAWAISVYFVAANLACKSSHMYLRKAFECSPELFVMKQWHYDVAPEVALECTKSQHVWVFDADVATQSHDSLCITSLLNKKCAGRSVCVLSREHFVGRVSSNWIKHSAILKIVFACVEKSTSGLMLLQMHEDLPDPCEHLFTLERRGLIPGLPHKLSHQAKEKSNLTMKFAEILWVQGQISRNREKTMLYVAIGVTVGIIFLLIAFIFYKTTVKVPVPARVVNLSQRHNVSKNNNRQCCTQHSLLKKRDKVECEYLLPKQVQRISNVNLIVHQDVDGSISYLVEPATQQNYNPQNKDLLDRLKASYVVPISQALMLQQKQLLNLQQHNHHYYHHHHSNQEDFYDNHPLPLCHQFPQCVYADIVRHLLQLHQQHLCQPLYLPHNSFQKNKQAIYSENTLFSNLNSSTHQQVEVHQKPQQLLMHKTPQTPHQPSIGRPQVSTNHQIIYNSLKNCQTLDSTSSPNIMKYLLKPANEKSFSPLIPPQSLPLAPNTEKPFLRELYYRHNMPQASFTLHKQPQKHQSQPMNQGGELQPQKNIQHLKQFNSTLPALRSHQKIFANNCYHNSNLYNNGNERKKERKYDIGAFEVISAINSHMPAPGLLSIPLERLYTNNNSESGYSKDETNSKEGRFLTLNQCSGCDANFCHTMNI